MVHLESIACITAVETVRIMTHVTGETELALNALLDGKINFVTKVRTFERRNFLECAQSINCLSLRFRFEKKIYI